MMHYSDSRFGAPVLLVMVLVCVAWKASFGQENGGERGVGNPGPWRPDNGDGTYKNPILFADYSDPDVIRVGDDFYLTASSFSC
ncbi:MAG: hypothetical protein ABSH08_16735, partial [Tepidisphaeraceae bacterium]